MNKKFQLNAGTGMAAGAVVALFIAMVVSAFTGDTAIWAWAIPIGVACGLAIGTARENVNAKDEEG